MTCGIYMITNKVNNHMYIGQSINIERRWKEHIRCKNVGTSIIEQAISKYGKDNFNFVIIVELENDATLLNEMEKYYIWKYNTYCSRENYNLTPGGDISPMKIPPVIKKISGKNNGFYGKHHTIESRRKMSQSKKKLYQDKNNCYWYGKKRPDISEQMIGDRHHNYGKYGTQSSNAKYTLWDSSCVLFIKRNLYKAKIFPARCFEFKYHGYRVSGVSFHEFLSCYIIKKIIEEELNG